MTEIDAVESPLREIFAGRRGEPAEVIPLLQAAQERLGYVPREALRVIARFTGVPESKVYGVATFYAQFKLTPMGRHHVMICRGTACHVRGGARILTAVKRELNLEEQQTSPDMKYTLETVACIGACALAPCLVVNKKVYGRLNPQKATAIFTQKE
ncbi:MAG: NADH dehydrogenase [Candidatus Fraserbacteria bacterium RBG_16_55_9]|uniref:NADH dehydrogenase n=1 Tax=Fraserbacteria sp. (strain RBG_16_55_9) TaxID=1817864 RepID=A0A1F5UV29_FRAXR|nr:MAG: NADH dehydrogenase [Candidatus Fraserbacteria bacterium RBG_16_55_9]